MADSRVQHRDAGACVLQRGGASALESPDASPSGALQGELARALADAVESAVIDGEMPQVAGACATGARLQVHRLSESRRVQISCERARDDSVAGGNEGAGVGTGSGFFSALPRALAGAMQKEGLPTEPANVVEALLPRLQGILGDRAKVMPLNGFLNFLCENSDGGQGVVTGREKGSSAGADGDSRSPPRRRQARSKQQLRGGGQAAGGGGGAGSGERELEIIFTRPECTDEVFALYKKYQMEVHKESEDEISRESFVHFLVETPLPHVSRADDPSAPAVGYGSHHMQFRLDGRLIAVSAVDVLPRCLSSKYAFWDPDLSYLSLGKVTACKEIDWVKQASVESPNLKYYYMGYYIDTCPKMSYKADYKPSELLCAKSLQWYSAEAAKEALKRERDSGKSAFVPLSEALLERDGAGGAQGGASCVVTRQAAEDLKLMIAPNRVVTLSWLKKQQHVPRAAVESLEEPLREVVRVCGPDLARRLVLVMGKGPRREEGPAEDAVARRSTA